MRLRWTALVLASGIAASSAAVAADRLFAGGAWAALRFGARCDAAARPLPPASNREKQARAGFAFEPRARRHGDFYVRLSRSPRLGSSVILTIGSQPFLLAGRGAWGWSRGAQQGAAIIAAARGASSMRIEARDSAGRRFADRYLLDGAPTAIDAAAAGCAIRAGTGLARTGKI
jgi:hypothetical protein